MDINKVAYWILVVGMVLSMCSLALGLMLNVLGLNPYMTASAAAIGVGALIATPYARVVAMVVASVLNRDRGLFIVSTFVIAVMILSLLYGLVFRVTPKG